MTSFYFPRFIFTPKAGKYSLKQEFCFSHIFFGYIDIKIIARIFITFRDRRISTAMRNGRARRELSIIDVDIGSSTCSKVSCAVAILNSYLKQV